MPAPVARGRRETDARVCAGPAYLAPLDTFALGTGMRRAEMLSLKWHEVDFARGLLFVRKTKWAKDPRKDKGLPFSSRVREVLMSLPRRGEFVFTTDRGRDVPGTTFTKTFTRPARAPGCASKSIGSVMSSVRASETMTLAPTASRG